MKLQVRHIDLRVLEMHTRFPFRYGIAELRKLPHLMVSAECEIDGKKSIGISADGLAPKWFTKNPNSSIEHDLKEMSSVIRSAAGIAIEISSHKSFFDWWHALYQAQADRYSSVAPPLLYNFGVSLIERAMIDAFCNHFNSPFSHLIRQNAFEIDPGLLRPVLKGVQIKQCLPDQPAGNLIVRHTVGLSDPLTDSEVTASERVNDGLPQSLESNIQQYGLTHFKIKLGGNPENDIARLHAISRVIKSSCRNQAFAFTLDGNEQFHSAESFRAMWETCSRDPKMAEFFKHLIFVEQPIFRDFALDENTQKSFLIWRDRPPLIIDESDGDFASLPRALDCGYIGTSHKNCKGVVKSIVNSCHLAMLRKQYPTQQFQLSAEDLSNVGPIALLQDLAVCSNLGINHVERNGHHYFAGLSMWPADIQSQATQHHPDIFTTAPAGSPTVRITNGLIDIGSILQSPFGIAFRPNTAQFESLDF